MMTIENHTYIPSYLRATKAKLLSADESKTLAISAQHGDIQARDHLIAANMGLVVHLAKRYVHNDANYDLEDLVGEGCIGLMKAIDKFDTTRGAFSTCAALWILQAIREALRSKAAMVHIPCWLEPIFKRLKQLHAEEPDLTLTELAQRLNTTTENVALLHALTYIKSLDVCIYDDDTTLLDTLVDDSTLDDVEVCETNTDIHAQAEKALSVLNERERYIISLRYGLDEESGIAATLTAIGEKLAISKERVRQVEKVAMKKMQAAMATVG